MLWSLFLLAGLVGAGQHVRLRDVAERFVPVAPVLGYVLILSVLHEAGGLPLAFYSGVLLERRFGLSTERLASWLGDQAKSLAIGLVLGGGGASIVYWFIHWSPERWWLPAGLVFAAIIVGLTNLVPVLLLPLFYSVKPLDHDRLRRATGRARRTRRGARSWRIRVGLVPEDEKGKRRAGRVGRHPTDSRVRHDADRVRG